MRPLDAIALLKREFQKAPTLPAGGISVLPDVALSLCDELTLAYGALEHGNDERYAALLREAEAITHLEALVHHFDEETRESCRRYLENYENAMIDHRAEDKG